jgi:RHS repeat-associated protein
MDQKIFLNTCAYGQVQAQNAARQNVTTAPRTPWLFTGRYYHPEVKLYDFRNRAYHPRIGRFMQVGPRSNEVCVLI